MQVVFTVFRFGFFAMNPLRFLAIVAAAFLCGCAAGPDFAPPAAPVVESFTSGPLPDKTAETETRGGAAQKFAHGENVPAEWWALFRCKALDRLVASSLAMNPGLEAARAALRAAEENLSAGEGAFLPRLDGEANISRQKQSGNGSTAASRPAFTLYNASVSVSYPLDVFGGVRREVEGLEALKEAQRFELEAARLALAANVATAAIQEAALRAQIAATQDIIGNERKLLDLLKKQFEAGAVAKSAVLAQEAELAQTLASLPPLEKQLQQTRHQLAALAGRFPGEPLEATFDLADLHLPETLPVSLPSQLVEQRPDIKAATARLNAASAAIGVATANMLPQITLTGGYGISAQTIASLFSPGTAVWSIGAGLLQPLFHGGELLHKKRAKEAEFDQAAAEYRGVVLSAFQEVADALRAVQMDAEAFKAQAAAEQSASESLKLTREQFSAGAVSYASLLSAQQALEKARIARAQAEARRYSDTVALFAALGGGWWNRDQKTEAVNQAEHSGSKTFSPAPTAKRNFAKGRQ